LGTRKLRESRKQKEITEVAYTGCDVLVVAPTGMGKPLPRNEG